jgi:excisionase family DNA binding protein
VTITPGGGAARGAAGRRSAAPHTEEAVEVGLRTASLERENMAGKFLSLDEVAQRLGISAEDVQRLVDRKQLYPLRDGKTLKFKPDDVERHAAQGGGSQIGGSGLSLDLDLDAAALSSPAASGGVTGSGGPVLSAAEGEAEISFGDDLLPAQDAAEPKEPGTVSLDSQAGDASGSADATGSGPVVGASGGSAAGLSLDVGDAVAAIPVTDEPFTGTLPIDLSGVESPAVGSNATGSGGVGSNVKGSGSALDLSGLGSNVGSALSGIVMEGGLSLDDDDVRKSGILSGEDFDDDMQSAISAVKSGAAQSGMDGDDFQALNPLDDEDGSGSDILGEESATAGSSFLEDDGTDSSFDVAGDLAALGTDEGEADIGAGVGLVRDTSFSVWQICGLVCCSLLMLTGGFVMFDLIRTLGTPGDLSMTSPLIGPLAELFGWRR